MTNTLTVSVGLSAYNEQTNISNLITSFLYQQESNFILKEIIVVSDGSTDKTVDLVQSFGDDRVRLIVHTDRGGKAKRLNEIIDVFTGDVLLLTDADVLPDDQNVISKMVEKFIGSNTTDLVLANVRPLPAINFFEGAVNNFFYAREGQADKFDFLSSIHGSRGAGLALRKEIAKKIVFPESLIIDDAFVYLFMKQHDLKVVAAKDAFIWFRSVRTPADFKKQIMRYMKGGEQLHSFFPDELILKESFVPKSVMLRVLFNQLNRDAFGYIYLKLTFLYCRLYLKYHSYRTSPKWIISKSSKLLQVQSETLPVKSPVFSKLWKTFGLIKGVILLWIAS